MTAHVNQEEVWAALFGDIGRYFANLLDRIATAISDSFTRIVNGLESLINKLSTSLTGIIDSVQSLVDNVFVKIQEFIETTINEIITFVDEILADVVEGIRTLVDTTTEYIKALTTDLVGFFEGMVADSKDYLTKLFDQVYTSILDLAEDASILFRDLFDTIVTYLQDIVDRVKLYITDLFELVSGAVTQILATGQQVVDDIAAGVKTFIDEVVGTVGDSLRDLLDTISNLPAEISELARRLTDSTVENIGNPINALPSAFIDKILTGVTGDNAQDNDRIMDGLLTMLFGSSPVNRSPETMRAIIKALTPAHPMSKFILTTVLSPLWILQTMGGIANANAQILLQEHAYENPYRLIEPEDIRRAWYRNLLVTTEATDELRKHGYTESAAEIMLAVAETIPPEREQLDWWLRGFTSEDQLDDSLKALGWGIENINLLKRAAWIVPPVQDLITMAVREVFTPEIAERFGQYEDYPPQFTEHAAKLGLSEEWATNYWAAHWALPSVNMGFEMLHRRVIDQSDLDLLLRATDVMPFWRDKLIAISYSPLTRVDIRRMHKLGVLTNDEVLSAYQDIGYDISNAQRLLDFTIALNGPSQSQDDTDLSALTKSNIINFYKDGVLKKDEAEQLLEDTGMSRAAADLYIGSAEMEIQRDERRSEIDIILDRADTGVITFEQAQDDLNRIGLETNEILIAITELSKREARRTKIPSKSDLDKMLRADLVTKIEYLDTLNRIGYSNYWAEKYLKLAQG